MVDPKKASELANVYTASDLVDDDIRFGVDDATNELSAQLSLAELKKAFTLVEASTAGSGSPNVLTSNESFHNLTNEGAAAKNYHTLPSAVAGLVFTFTVQDADGLRITAGAGDTIRLGSNVTATAGYIESVNIGNEVTLVSINATEWVGVAYGTWTDGTFTYVHAAMSYSAALPTIPALTVGATLTESAASNIDLIVAPKGTGSLRARTGGNARGANSIDLQMSATDTQVAGANNSFCIGSGNTTASGGYSGGACIGINNTTSASYGYCIGGGNQTSSNYCIALGGNSSAYIYGQLSHAYGNFAAVGDCQMSFLHVRNSTTNATQTELFIDGASARAVVPASKVWQFNAQVLGVQTGGAAGTQFDTKAWEITGSIRRNGAGSTVLPYAITKTVVGEVAAATAWDVTIEADDTNEALVVKVTGEANKNIRWHATIRLNEIGQ